MWNVFKNIKGTKQSTTQLMFTFAYKEKEKYMSMCLHYKKYYMVTCK